MQAGYTALIYAALKEHTEIVYLLLTKRPDLNVDAAAIKVNLIIFDVTIFIV